LTLRTCSKATTLRPVPTQRPLKLAL